MNYLEALKEAEKGKKIRRPKWDNGGLPLLLNTEWYSKRFGRLCLYGIIPDSPVRFSNTLANDWVAY